MKTQIIKKTSSSFSNTPVLANLEKERRTFKLDSIKKDIDYMRGGQLNAAYNAIERHALSWRRFKLAMIWVRADGEEVRYTYGDLANLSGQFANVLGGLKVITGDRVFFFLSRVPAMYYGFLGTLRTGAIAGTLFSAFGKQALMDRLDNSAAKVLITEPELLPRIVEIAQNLPHLKYILVAENGKKWQKPTIKGKKIYSLDDLMVKASCNYKTKFVSPQTAAFMLYASGTTGKPKGIVHTHQAIIQQFYTAKTVLDLQDDDLFWCTADPGWITGISYTLLGGFCAGATLLVYNGRFGSENWYYLIEKYQVTVWYTAPTAIRMLQASGDKILEKYNFSSLRHLVSVGEPLNPKEIYWGIRAFGLPFHDTWFQTETGAITIANYPCMDIKVGSMGKPIPGVVAAIVDDRGQPVSAGIEGHLVLKPGWPSMMRKIWRRPERFKACFKSGWYYTGDKAYRDKDGYYWFTGREDDLIKTSGERVGPTEVELAIEEHLAVSEAAVVGITDSLRGEIIKAFVRLKQGYKGDVKLVKSIQQFVKKNLAGHAYPREVEFVDQLPKTQSGKIIRKLLKAKELGLPTGNTSR